MLRLAAALECGGLPPPPAQASLRNPRRRQAAALHARLPSILKSEQTTRPAAFRDAAPFALAASIALAAGALLDAVLFILTVPRPQLMQLHLLLRLATAAAFMGWLDRVYANVESLDGTTTYPRWWAIGGFVIPPFMTFRPCQIVAEVWLRSSDPDDRPYIVYGWWSAFLLAPALWVLQRKPMSYLINIVAAGLAIAVVQLVTRRQDHARELVRAAERAIAAAEKKARLTAAATGVAPLPTASPAPPAPASLPINVPISAQKLAAIEAVSRAPRPVGGQAPSPVAPVVPRRQARTPVPPLDGRFVGVLLCIAGAAMLFTAAQIGFDSQLAAAAYAVFGVIVLIIARFVGRHRLEKDAPPEGWGLITVVGVAVVALNLVVLLVMASR